MLAEPTGLQIDVSPNAGGAVLCLSGEIDADSAESLVATVGPLAQQGRRKLVLDCADVTFCDSFGLRAMTVLWDQVQPDGSVTIARPSAMLSRILEITGLAGRFGVAEGSN